MAPDLLTITPAGLYCPQGDFYIDPWHPVDRAVITHAHADHARPGSRTYLTSPTGASLLARRVDANAAIRALPFGESLSVNGVSVSLHPAGHLLGSAQVRVEYHGQVWVVSGDYKTEHDVTCEPFAPVKCHTFITESTFGLPIYRWRPQQEIFDAVNRWWQENQTVGRTSILFAYSLGKAQRMLAGLEPAIGPILVHGAVQGFTELYRAAGRSQPHVIYADSDAAKAHKGRALVIAPPSAAGMDGWLRKFGARSLAFASGWMTIRGARRRRAVDRGFVLSDHVDWPGLLAAVTATGAERIGVTHGYVNQTARYLNENGWQAEIIQTRFTGERGEDEDPVSRAEQPAAEGDPDAQEIGED